MALEELEAEVRMNAGDPDYIWRGRQATPRVVDFTRVSQLLDHSSGVIRDRGGVEVAGSVDNRPMTPEGKLLTPKQIRARARRRVAKVRATGRGVTKGAVTEQEFNAIYKPLDEWDMEELAKGRPRNAQGNFKGSKPGWITREVHEQAMERFQAAIKTDMNMQGISALDALKYVLNNEDVDNRGKPIVPASTKVQAATFFLEHIVGKPKQHITQDISVKLQSILGAVMVNPNDALAAPSQGGQFGDDDDLPGYSLAHTPGITIPMGSVIEGEVLDDDDFDLDEGE